MSRTNVPSVD